MNYKFSRIDSFIGNTYNANHFFHRPCPLCGSERSEKVWGVGDFQFFSDSSIASKRANITDVQCNDCLCLYRNPCFTDTGFAALFREAGCSYGAAEQRPEEQIKWLATRGLLQPGKVFLDVGCYEGAFLSRLPPSVRRIGVDCDADAIARGSKGQNGVTLYHSRFETFHPTEKPDVITMFHVLEHLTSPRKVLERLADISTENAELVVEVPLLETGDTNDINGFFSVQHVTHFTESTLSEMLRSSGWNIELSTNISHYNGFRVLATKTRSHPIEIRSHSDDCILLKEHLRTWHTAIDRVENKLSHLPENGKFIIWGGGMHTELLYQRTSFFRQGDRRFLLVDNDPLKLGTSWRGLEVASPKELVNLHGAYDYVLISSYGSQDEINKRIRSLGVDPIKIVILYDQSRAY